MRLSLSPTQVRLLRLAAQRLLPGSVQANLAPHALVKRIFGVQAQELPAAHLALRARSQGFSREEVERERQEQRSLLWTWAMRGTLHLLTVEDARWLIPFLGPAMIAAHWPRLRQLGWNEENLAAGRRLIVDQLSRHGPSTRPQIDALLEENRLPHVGQASIHLLYRLTFEGWLCRAADLEKETTYTLFETWAGRPQPLSTVEALTELARRYMLAYGPADVKDFATWAGLKMSQARQAWQQLASELIPVDAAGTPAEMLPAQFSRLDEITDQPPVVNLLPRYDPYLLGYAHRNLAVDPAFGRRIHPGGGVIQSAVLVNGEARGTWKARPHKRRSEILVEPFGSFEAPVWVQIEAEVADLGRYLNTPTLLKRISAG